MAKKLKKNVDSKIFRDKLKLTGLKLSFIAERIGMTRVHMNHALNRGFRADEVQKIEELLRDVGHELIAFRIPDRAKHPGYQHEQS